MFDHTYTTSTIATCIKYEKTQVYVAIATATEYHSDTRLS